MADILYSGGSCSGKHETVPDTFSATGISCGGTNYTIYRETTDHWLALPRGSRPPPTPTTASSPRAGHAWHRLVHTMKKRVPDNLRRSQAARRRMLRIGRR